MELDSVIIVQMIKGISNIPWNLITMIEDIQQRIREREIQVSRCYREGNTVADALSKHAISIEHEIYFDSEDQLPREVKGPFFMDKLDMPSFRLKVDKHSSWHFDPS
ncbi:hypothetical protein RDI58_004113 [Solanum bulbocastanum]|uniref:RNase H type-1 domain-containing protein n=1 Tax=Solanum bulbocastanum TaxID=147425 RepID=A0AAN8U5X4_SOLBU